MSARRTTLALITALTAGFGAAAPALAAPSSPSVPNAAGTRAAGANTAAPVNSGATERDEKLPAQLPAVNVQGEDRSSSGADVNGKLTPAEAAEVGRARLPEVPARRATSEANRALTVNVTPTTLEPPPESTPPVMPYTSLTVGWGPLTQYRVSLYDSRFWGPALGTTEIGGRAGWNWSGWRAKEWIDWSGIGRLALDGEGFAWQQASPAGQALTGAQQMAHAHVEHGESENFLVAADGDLGALNDGRATASPFGPGTSLLTQTGSLAVQWRPQAIADHRWTLKAQGQARRWGDLVGPEGYVSATDFWSLSDEVQLEAGLGGGQWGFEPIVDPKAVFHYRPTPSTHAFVGLRTGSELPDFRALYAGRPATAPNTALQGERHEGWATAGLSHRWNEVFYATANLDLRRSFRRIYWASPAADGLWTPLNAANEQWSHGAELRGAAQWTPSLLQDVTLASEGISPLGFSQQRLGTRLTASALEQKLSVSAGVEGRYARLGAAQLAGGGSGYGVFAEGEARYAFQRDWAVVLTVEDAPLAIVQPGPNYFAPTPLLTISSQYQF